MHINLLIYVDFQNPLQIYYKYFEYARFLEKKNIYSSKNLHICKNCSIFALRNHS